MDPKLISVSIRVFGPLEYSSVLNTSHVATIWNFDPNFSLPHVTRFSLPKMFQIVATWLVFSKEELCAYKQALNAQKNWKTSILWLLAIASPKSILLLTTEEYPDAVSTFTVFALQIAISGLQCYFPIHKVWGQPGALQALLLFLLHKTTNDTIYMYVCPLHRLQTKVCLSSHGSWASF